MRISFKRFIVVAPSVATTLSHGETLHVDFLLRESDQLSNRKTSIKINFFLPSVATTLLQGETLHLALLLRESDKLSNRKNATHRKTSIEIDMFFNFPLARQASKHGWWNVLITKVLLTEPTRLQS